MNFYLHILNYDNYNLAYRAQLVIVFKRIHSVCLSTIWNVVHGFPPLEINQLSILVSATFIIWNLEKDEKTFHVESETTMESVRLIFKFIHIFLKLIQS